MPYLRNEPIATDDLDVSQPKLANNTNASDDSFGVDHYKFSDLTSNNGFHNTVTTPLIIGAAHPATTTNPIFYAMEDTANIGLLQYSRGPNSAVPSPVTYLQAGVPFVSFPNGTAVNILDFTGISKAVFTLYYGNMDPANPYNKEDLIWWYANGSPANVFNGVTNSFINNGPFATNTGSILQIFVRSAGVTLSNGYWALKFHRIWS